MKIGMFSGAWLVSIGVNRPTVKLFDTGIVFCLCQNLMGHFSAPLQTAVCMHHASLLTTDKTD
jgi:hypothetical protein